MGRNEELMAARENGEEVEEEIYDPHSLVGQIEATAAREEAAQKLALEMARIDAHNRLEARKMRRQSSKKSTQVVPVADGEATKETPKDTLNETLTTKEALRETLKETPKEMDPGESLGEI